MLVWLLTKGQPHKAQSTRDTRCQILLTILGIESSCDETAAAVVRAESPADAKILSNVVFGQETLHRAYNGVVPEIAARAHAERIDLAVEQALDNAGLRVGDCDAVAVTAGPGLIGGVISGVMAAHGMAAGAGLPLIAVNHLEGHALTPRLSHGVAFPYLLLLVSGGHCQFLAVEDLGRYRRLGGTIDDAPGEAFDKVAKMLGLGFPGGPEVERWARDGDADRFALPRPLLDRKGADMSFSGLKTAVLRARDELILAQGGLFRRDVADLCAAFQKAVADVLSAKSRIALAMIHTPVLAVAGGVAANTSLRSELEQVASDNQVSLVAPPLALCTDNGAMIAWAGLERHQAGLPFDSAIPRPRWPLDRDADPMLGSGKRGAKA